MLPKFRVWYNVDEGKMYPVQSIRTNKDGSVTVNATDNPDDWNPILVSGKWQTGYLMISTGLKDINGIDIFEGDIIKCGTLIGTVIFDKTRWVIELKNPIPEMEIGVVSLSPNSNKNTEVIGNIYENGYAGIRKKSHQKWR